MNCGKHRRPSIRRPTAARQRYEQSRLSEKTETARNGNFRPAIRRPTAKVGSKTATSRQNVAAAPKRSASTGYPNKNGFSPLPAHSGDPHRTLPAFSRKNKLLSGKEPTIHAAHSGRIQTIKELLTQPANGRIRPRTAETPPPKAESSQSTFPGYRFAAQRTRSTAPTTAAAATAAGTSRKRIRPLQSQRRKTRLQRSFWKRNDPNSPPKKGLKRESELQTQPPAANERTSNDGH